MADPIEHLSTPNGEVGIRGAGWRADCPRCVGSKFSCDEHFAALKASSDPMPSVAIAKAAILGVGIGGGSTFDAQDRDEMAQDWAVAVVAALSSSSATPDPTAGELIEALEEVRDLLAERIFGNPARSSAHNARVKLESIIAKVRS